MNLVVSMLQISHHDFALHKSIRKMLLSRQISYPLQSFGPLAYLGTWYLFTRQCNGHYLCRRLHKVDWGNRWRAFGQKCLMVLVPDLLLASVMESSNRCSSCSRHFLDIFDVRIASGLVVVVPLVRCWAAVDPGDDNGVPKARFNPSSSGGSSDELGSIVAVEEEEEANVCKAFKTGDRIFAESGKLDIEDVVFDTGDADDGVFDAVQVDDDSLVLMLDGNLLIASKISDAFDVSDSFVIGLFVAVDNCNIIVRFEPNEPIGVDTCRPLEASTVLTIVVWQRRTQGSSNSFLIMNELSPRPRNDYAKYQFDVKNIFLQHQLVRGKHIDKNTQDVNFFLPSKSPRILDFK